MRKSKSLRWRTPACIKEELSTSAHTSQSPIKDQKRETTEINEDPAGCQPCDPVHVQGSHGLNKGYIIYTRSTRNLKSVWNISRGKEEMYIASNAGMFQERTAAASSNFDYFVKQATHLRVVCSSVFRNVC